jgi:hypothetical protein
MKSMLTFEFKSSSKLTVVCAAHENMRNGAIQIEFVANPVRYSRRLGSEMRARLQRALALVRKRLSRVPVSSKNPSCGRSPEVKSMPIQNDSERRRRGVVS